jgi:two-component system sensor histidine kinase KdpD
LKHPASGVVRTGLRIVLAGGIIAAITLVDLRLGTVNNTTVCLTLLVAVLAIAARWGLPESLVASLTAVLCFNFYFLPPVRTWTVADPQNWVALFAFLITAAVASQLSASAKRRAAETSRAEAARQNEELRSTILDALAHEFKTPLTSIKAAVTSLLSNSPSAQRELLQIVDEETDHLTSMVTDVIRTARIEAGQVELCRGAHSVADMVRRSLAMLASSLDSRIVEVHVDGDLPPVAADPELVGIVIRQLIGNAAKYSPPDSVVTIRALRQADSVLVGVADRGPGISEADRSRVFEKFYRGKEARERTPGTGIGLAIAREIILAHSGEIRVESRPGGGSELLFSLPIARTGT